VLRWMIEGKSNLEIPVTFGLSTRFVERHVLKSAGR
jgi:DNA-binding CsgD family transcriptional regulator